MPQNGRNCSVDRSRLVAHHKGVAVYMIRDCVDVSAGALVENTAWHAAPAPIHEFVQYAKAEIVGEGSQWRRHVVSAGNNSQIFLPVRGLTPARLYHRRPIE